MRVLHFNTHASGGGYEYATVLCDALAKEGIESRLLCKALPPTRGSRPFFNRLIRRSFVSWPAIPGSGPGHFCCCTVPKNWKKFDVRTSAPMADWFDFRALEALGVKEGIISFHHVDDHPETNLACREILKTEGLCAMGLLP